MGAKRVGPKRAKVVTEVIVSLAIAKNVLACLQEVATRARDAFRGNMALVVLAHECMAKSALCHQTIKAPRKFEKCAGGRKEG